MIIAASCSSFIQSVPETESSQNAIASVQPSTSVVSLNSPSTFPGTAERPDIVNAGDSVVSRIGDDSGLGGRLGTDAGLPRDNRFDDPNAAFDEPNAGLPQIGGFDPAHDLNLPGGEAATSPGSVIVSCVVGAVGGAAKGGAWGAAAGCVVGVSAGLQQDTAADAIDGFIDWIAGGAAPKEDLTPVPMGTPQDMGVPVDPKSDPNPESDAQGGYIPKFAPPSLGWLNQINVRPEVGDPIGVEKNEPSNVLRFFGQAVDPNPEADNANDGAAMKAILSTSGAVTDPLPDLAATLNMLRLATLRG